MEDDFRVSNGGSTLHLTFMQDGLPFSVLGAMEIKVIFFKKNGTKTVKNATLENDGADGKIKYVFSTDDLDIDGNWKVQGYVKFSNTVQVYSSIVEFSVGSNL